MNLTCLQFAESFCLSKLMTDERPLRCKSAAFEDWRRSEEQEVWTTGWIRACDVEAGRLVEGANFVEGRWLQIT